MYFLLIRNLVPMTSHVTLEPVRVAITDIAWIQSAQVCLPVCIQNLRACLYMHTRMCDLTRKFLHQSLAL